MNEDVRTMQKLRIAAHAVLTLVPDLDEKQRRGVLADLEDMKALGAVGFVKAMAARIAKSRGVA